MENEPHDVVKLMVARMESHPEEFLGTARYGGRWTDVLNTITTYGIEADKKAIAKATRDLFLGEAHKEALDELLNGEERRAEAEREKLEIQRIRMQSLQQQMAAQKYGQAQQQYSQGALSSQLAGVSPTDFTPGLRGTSLTSIGNAINTANALQLGNEKLDESILKKLKKAAGL